ncbi:MAG TPA: glutaredoxin domain-containing protein, partial [Dehalococcoidia bacterium]|nr:glutaredoxin domain-containing protein [Dehalococcoidia bacterium]
MPDKLIIYTTPNCSACDRALADLAADGVDFEERNVMKNKQFYDEALKYAITVPIILREGKVEYGWKGNIG